MSATAYALGLIRAHNGRLGRHERLALLALSALADEALDSPNGLAHVWPSDVAIVAGLSTSTVNRTLRGLANAGMVTLVASRKGRRVTLCPTPTTLPTNHRIIGWRPNEEAFA